MNVSLVWKVDGSVTARECHNRDVSRQRGQAVSPELRLAEARQGMAG